LHRYLDGQIPPQSRIIGAARSDLDTDAFRKMVHEARGKFAPGACVDEAKCDEFMAHIHYARLDATAPATEWGPLKDALADGAGIVRVFYLPTAPSLFVTIARGRAEPGLATPSSRIVLEEPSGRDLAASREINDGAGAVFDEHNTFRI